MAQAAETVTADSHEERGLITTKHDYVLSLPDGHARFHVHDRPVLGQALFAFHLQQERDGLRRHHRIGYDAHAKGMETSVVAGPDPDVAAEVVDGWMPDEMEMRPWQEGMEFVKEKNDRQVDITHREMDDRFDEPRYVGRSFYGNHAAHDDYGSLFVRPTYLSGVVETEDGPEHMLRCLTYKHDMYERATELLEFAGYDPAEMEGRMEEMSGTRPPVLPE